MPTHGPAHAGAGPDAVRLPPADPPVDGSSDRDEELEGSLARLLDARIEVLNVLPLVACLDELIRSLRHVRSITWRYDQRHSLARDIDAAVEVLGGQLRTELGTALDDVCALSRRLLNVKRGADFIRHPELNRLPTEAEALRERLTESAVLRAAWRDVVDGVRDALPERVLEDRVRLLFAMLAAAHQDTDKDRRHLHWVIADGGVPWSEQGDDRDPPSTSWRLAECETYVSRAADSGHCVAWVALEGTRLPEFVIEAGSVTFLEAEWAVPNAKLDNGQDFLHRDELREIAAHSFGAFGDIPQDANVVLVRVELGEHPAAEALDEAWRRAMFVAGYATLSARSDPWPKRGWYCLAVDGARTHGWFAPDELFRERTSSQIERTSFELKEIAKALDAKSGWSSPELIEAVDCANEARGADVRNRNILRWRVLEMVAAYAGLDEVNDLLRLLRGQWARDGLRSRPVRAIMRNLMGYPRGAPDQELARTLNIDILKHQPHGRIKVLVRDALARRADLLAVARTRLDSDSLDQHLKVLSSGAKALERLAELDREEGLLFSRTRRVRNALTHGDPVTIEAISSVDNYLMYMTEFALQEAVTSPAGKPLTDTLTDIQTERAEMRGRLQAGDDPIQVLGLDGS